MGNQNVIEINGRRYDAVSGTMIEEKPSQKSDAAIKVIHPAKNGTSVDGFMKAKRTSKPLPEKARTSPHHVAKKPQKSQVLMRTSVNKPVAAITKPKKTTPTIQKSQLGASHRRANQAKSTQKSPMVQKFEHPAQRSSVVKKHAEIAVHHAPHAVQTKSVAIPAQSTTTVQHAPLKRPEMRASEKIIEAALANATSHEHKPVKHKSSKRRRLSKKLGVSPRAIAMSSAVLAGVLLGGFFAVQNVPNLAMRVAATRAGFDASMPGYQPSGFSFKGPINYTAGKVTVSFKSNTDQRSYSVVQQSSNWSSDALLSNFITDNDKQYQTYLDRGRTLYIYEGSNATWVDDGIWYQIEGESAMTTDQLIRIAASI